MMASNFNGRTAWQSRRLDLRRSRVEILVSNPVPSDAAHDDVVKATLMGEKIRTARKSGNFGVAVVARMLGIPAKDLVALEQGQRAFARVEAYEIVESRILAAAKYGMESSETAGWNNTKRAAARRRSKE